jgi:Na+/glutamate symporter
MDITPTPNEADEALRQIRHQQAESVRNAYKPGPWWAHLVLTAFFVSYGLGKDLDSVWGTVFQVLCWLVLAAVAVVQWRRRQIKRSVATSMRMNDPLTWVLIIGFTAATLAVLFGGPHLLASFDVPFPHAISGLATGLMLILAIPLGRWQVRRSIARIESGER